MFRGKFLRQVHYEKDNRHSKSTNEPFDSEKLIQVQKIGKQKKQRQFSHGKNLSLELDIVIPTLNRPSTSTIRITQRASKGEFLKTKNI